MIIISEFEKAFLDAKIKWPNEHHIKKIVFFKFGILLQIVGISE